MVAIPEWLQRQKSLEELEEEESVYEKKLSIAQKKAAIAELKRRGGNPNDFKDGKGGFSITRIIEWLKNH